MSTAPDRYCHKCGLKLGPFSTIRDGHEYHQECAPPPPLFDELDRSMEREAIRDLIIGHRPSAYLNDAAQRAKKAVVDAIVTHFDRKFPT